MYGDLSFEEAELILFEIFVETDLSLGEGLLF